MANILEPDLELALAPANTTLHVEHYRAQGAPRASLVMVHGFSSHCGLYRHVGRFFAAEGFAVTQYDARGHGRSEGQRGHVDDFADYTNDLRAIVQWARGQSPGCPWILMGHSMGCAVSLAFLLDGGSEARPARLVLAAPWLKLGMKISAPKKAAANVLARVAPAFVMDNGLRPEQLSRNPLVLENFHKDNLVHHVASAGWFMSALRIQARIRLNADKVDLPTLMLLAGEDRIVANEANEAFAKGAGDWVTIRRYHGLYHELYLEPEAEKVLIDIGTWLDGEPELKTA